MTLILKANQAMTAPLAETPRLPDIATALSYDFNPDLLRASIANGAAVPSISSTGSQALTLNNKIPELSFPTLTHAGPNGKAALTFAGNHMITVTDGGATTFEYGTDSTIALVVRANSYTDTQRILGVSLNDGFRYISPFAGGLRANGSDTQGTDGGGSLTGPAASGAWHVVIAAIGGPNRSLFKIDGAAPAAGNIARGRFRGLRLGHTGGDVVNAASAFNGDIARVQIFRRLLSAADMDGLAYELMTTYGIA